MCSMCIKHTLGWLQTAVSVFMEPEVNKTKSATGFRAELNRKMRITKLNFLIDFPQL